MQMRTRKPPALANCGTPPLRGGMDGDFARFFRSWMANPLRVSAIAPSGRRLAALMTREIEPDGGPVIELGPGTGVFTRALLGRGVPERDLTLVEFCSEFAPALRERFPEATVLQMDAVRLGELPGWAERRPGYVVSGLPLLSMPPAQRRKILAAAFSVLRPEGRFYQFTYGPRPPVSREMLGELGLAAARIGSTLGNLPPASVYRFQRPGR
ncbi:class I SAM-dependent methyltransferase [Mangrovicoccus ximenensis]|uniref:class I SAM-dependent methyltransferase n=1 Tax=Mangrovicoccus ximenensis TaxID=1911570 RepID=UPI00191C04BA|nr:methyltransferase domain-containing protein [Mangrovicoccus ximenensis]